MFIRLSFTTTQYIYLYQHGVAFCQLHQQFLTQSSESAKALSSSTHFWKPVLCQWSWLGSACLTCSSAVLWWALTRYYENVISASSKQLQSRGYKVEDDGVPSHTLQSTFPSLTFRWILPARIWATRSKTSHKKQYWCGYSDHDRIIRNCWKFLL